MYNNLNTKNDFEKLRIVSAFFRCIKKFIVQTTEVYDEQFFENLKFPILNLIWKFNYINSKNYKCDNDNQQTFLNYKLDEQKVFL